jgi:predicted HAD superfamily phosphohydrolase YqeG
MRQLLGLVAAERKGGTTVVVTSKSHYSELVTKVNRWIVRVVASVIVISHE